jgi:hypothetical protein
MLDYAHSGQCRRLAHGAADQIEEGVALDAHQLVDVTIWRDLEH